LARATPPAQPKPPQSSPMHARTSHTCSGSTHRHDHHGHVRECAHELEL
jgi:hypothetical protein